MCGVKSGVDCGKYDSFSVGRLFIVLKNCLVIIYWFLNIVVFFLLLRQEDFVLVQLFQYFGWFCSSIKFKL